MDKWDLYTVKKEEFHRVSSKWKWSLLEGGGKKGVRRRFFSRLAHGWAREIRPRSRSLDTHGGMQTFIAWSSRTDDAHVSTFVVRETHLGTSFFSFGRNTRSGWRTASIHCNFLPHRDLYFLIKQRTSSARTTKNECTIVTLSWRCLQLGACSYEYFRTSRYRCWFARFGIVKTKMKRLFLVSRGQVRT